MALQGGFGEITANRMAASMVIHTCSTPDCDISDVCPWYTTRTTYRVPELSNLPGDIAIVSIQLIYQFACAGLAGNVDVGIETDTTCYVDHHATSIVAVAGDHDGCTLEDGKREVTQKTHGLPVHKAGENMLVTLSIGAGNTGDFALKFTFIPIDPGI